MTEPQGDHRGVHTGPEQGHGAGVAQHVRCNRLGRQGGAASARGGHVFGEQERDRVRAESPAGAGGEQRLIGVSLSFGEPGTQGRDGSAGQGCAALFAALAGLCRALVYAEERFGELEVPCQARESGRWVAGQLGIILAADRGFLHAGPWVSGEGGDDDESVRGRGERPAPAVQARL
jgi:hypothetical protein